MIDDNERRYRADQFRSWYDRLPTASMKSSMKRKLIDELHIGIQSFYDLLSGRVYINPYKQNRIEAIIGKEIFI